MTQHDQLWVNSAYPIAAYLIAFIGSALGLACTSRLHVVGLPQGKGWLVAGAISLGTGIWGMHFIAMLGYEVHGVSLHYALLPTAFSWVVAVLFVGIGMTLVGRDSSPRSLLGAGLLSGLGIAGMHYLGMVAMIMPGSMHYKGPVVALSVVIAVVAATAALWATLRAIGILFRIIAALVMGVAVGGMHYTGMLALTSMADHDADTLGGVSASAFVVPLTVGLTLIIFVVGFTVLLNPVSDLERAKDDLRNTTPTPAPGRSVDPLGVD